MHIICCCLSFEMHSCKSQCKVVPNRSWWLCIKEQAACPLICFLLEVYMSSVGPVLIRLTVIVDLVASLGCSVKCFCME